MGFFNMSVFPLIPSLAPGFAGMRPKCGDSFGRQSVRTRYGGKPDYLTPIIQAVTEMAHAKFGGAIPQGLPRFHRASAELGLFKEDGKN